MGRERRYSDEINPKEVLVLISTKETLQSYCLKLHLNGLLYLARKQSNFVKIYSLHLD